MQFYLDGYRPGDPHVRPAAAHHQKPDSLPEQVDILVVGTGPAGSVLSAQLSEFPDIRTLVVERREGPLQVGQADGVACRTVEMFQAFGLADRLMREAYWVNETVFWKPDENDASTIVRSGRVQDVAEGLSEFPHVIVNQARMQEYLLEHMRSSPTRLEPAYGLELVDLDIAEEGTHPVTATLRRVSGEGFAVRAKYVVGCDGARSAVRRSIGSKLHGDARNHAWGVMDVLAVTDFPDVRFKSAVQSCSGSLLIIPREGGYLVRYYVDLGDLDPRDGDARKQFTQERVISQARKILHPYTLEVKDVAWWSVYEVGQRIADRFDNLPNAGDPATPRVFIAGDACHTHSAKAGQGMNVSMQDAFNLGWKLSSVIRGQSPPSLLRTYSAERRAVAQKLIEFDHVWSSAMAAGAKSPQNPGGMDPSQVQRIFSEGGRFTAGFGTQYNPSMITAEGTYQHLAEGFPIGERFHSAPVIRLADAKPLGLGHVAEADGRWRLYLFADNAHPQDTGSRLSALCDFLSQSSASPVLRHTPAGTDPDSVFDIRAVMQQGHRELTVCELPELLMPRKGPFGLVDYEKVFTPDLKNGPHIYEERSVHRGSGCIVVVRPDQYIAHVLPLDAHGELAEYFHRVMFPQNT
ncbi:FAD-binding monooxygenase [Nesterenkonia ebinurensis]|uniref:FAD-binding monooxygenase n=1 Tax=Nesterenkonia ebinurensis TaxID=2608252 RepID=UPI00123CB679|nr:FAD-binding monooxygenase [Nesterenkonia ebinurensis]